MRIQFIDDILGNFQETHGSNSRLNVSSRADGRRYYNSRDAKQSYSFTWTFADAVTGETAAFLKNTSTDGKHLVIDAVGLNSATATRFKMSFVTGSPANGTSVTPTNLNKTSSNAAAADAQEGAAAANGVTNLTPDGEIDFAFCTADGHEEFRLADTVRLGQNDAIEIEVFETGSAPDVSGVIFFYFE